MSGKKQKEPSENSNGSQKTGLKIKPADDPIGPAFVF
jgi:hypothetical protein